MTESNRKKIVLIVESLVRTAYFVAIGVLVIAVWLATTPPQSGFDMRDFLMWALGAANMFFAFKSARDARVTARSLDIDCASSNAAE